MGRTPCCEKKGVRRGQWTEEEDQILISHIQKHGHANWRALPKKAGLQRCGKSCRLRWVNYLSPDVKRGNLTSQEEEAIISLHQKLGNKWSAIAARLPGRTDNEIKNVWNTHLKKRVMPNENGNMKKSSKKNLTTIDQAGVDYSHVLHGHDHALMMEDFSSNHMVAGGCQAAAASSEISSSLSDYSSISSQATWDQSVDYGFDCDPAEVNFNELQDLSSGFLSEPVGLGIASIDWMDGQSALSSIAWEEEEGDMGYWMRMLVLSEQAPAEF